MADVSGCSNGDGEEAEELETMGDAAAAAAAKKKRSQSEYERMYGEFMRKSYGESFSGLEDSERAAIFRKTAVFFGIYQRLQDSLRASLSN